MGNIAHASIDENKKVSGGVAGDQTGKEVCIRSWYNKPWTVVIRAYDPKMRDKIAMFMVKAADNYNIGYDQSQRNTLHYALKKIDFNVAKVPTACETDCSALVSDACIAAGVPESALFINGNLSTTSSLKYRLSQTGLFEIITDKSIVNAESKLCKGDILLAEGRHVAVYVSKQTRPMIRKGDSCFDVKAMRGALKNFGIQISVTKDFDQVAENALIEFQGYNELDKDGICGPMSWEKIERYV